jgi:predicted GIY-YIG superfamily endonuclease
MSDAILASGLGVLASLATTKDRISIATWAGNYLITLNGVPYYLGESEDVASRLKSKFNPRLSTFYRSYAKSKGSMGVEVIEAFTVCATKVTIGRKELEEFGIVNLRTSLNKSHTNKRRLFSGKADPDVWRVVQDSAESLLDEGEKALMTSPVNLWDSVSCPDDPGIYMVWNELENVIYIGESASLRERKVTHSSTTYFSALRRHVATGILGYSLKLKNGKHRYLDPQEDVGVNRFLKGCKMKYLIVRFGRRELEERLIEEHRPLLNVKHNQD